MHPEKQTQLPTKRICVGIIPSRYASSRFCGKPLALILGKPMFWHVYQRAKLCPEFSKVVLATDDERIAAAAESLSVPFLMTRTNHQSGSDRVFEAAKLLNLTDDSLVVNIQGDEPALNPEMLSELIKPFLTKPDIKVATLAHKIDFTAAQNSDKVKIVTNLQGQALYFSRQLIPYTPENLNNNQSYLAHIGLYAFKLKTLGEFTRLPQSPLEKAEKLEQLRLLENNIPIEIVLTKHKSHGVDRPEDIAVIEKIMKDLFKTTSINN